MSENQNQTMNAQHTPGPWTWNSTDASIWPTAGRRAPIAEIFTAMEPKSELSETADHFTAEEMANARLIASAPELLACAEEFIVEYNRYFADSYNQSPLGELATRTRAAIAKAKGAQ